MNEFVYFSPLKTYFNTGENISLILKLNFDKIFYYKWQKFMFLFILLATIINIKDSRSFTNVIFDVLSCLFDNYNSVFY